LDIRLDEAAAAKEEGDLVVEEEGQAAQGDAGQGESQHMQLL